MLPSKSYLFLLLVAYATAASLAPRTATRSERSDDANAVEYEYGGKLHGRCSYVDRTKRSISLVYEEQNGVIKARSLNTVVEDPVASVRECRAAAEKAQVIRESRGISDITLHRNREGRQFDGTRDPRFNTRDPRFITWLGSMFGGGTNIGSSANNNFGLSWGNGGTGSYNPFPGVNLFAPSNNGNQLTTTYGNTNPFNFLNSASGNTGPWGVLNSISNGNNLFGLGGGLFSPFGGFFG